MMAGVIGLRVTVRAGVQEAEARELVGQSGVVLERHPEDGRLLVMLDNGDLWYFRPHNLRCVKVEVPGELELVQPASEPAVGEKENVHPFPDLVGRWLQVTWIDSLNTTQRLYCLGWQDGLLYLQTDITGDNPFFAPINTISEMEFDITN